MKSSIQYLKTTAQKLLFVASVCSVSLANSGSAVGMDAKLNGGGIEVNGEDNLISTHQKNKYRKDATRLALRQLAGQQSFDELETEVPKSLVDPIYEGLIAVHQSELPEAKIVTKVHKLHTFPTPTVDRLVVIYKRDAAWATPLRLGDDVTDNDKINQLSEKFKLKIDRNVEWDEEHFSFNMRAEESINIASVAKVLSTVESVTLVDMLEPNGDGNDIEVKKVANGLEINYIIKFDGCISGCKKRHTWTFEVADNGKVTFKGESGDELPKWMQ